MTLRDKVSALFGLPIRDTSYRLYLASMNESGKITARSLLDLMTIVLETLDEMEKKDQML
jgi:hypothetical protein